MSGVDVGKHRKEYSIRTTRILPSVIRSIVFIKIEARETIGRGSRRSVTRIGNTRAIGRRWTGSRLDIATSKGTRKKDCVTGMSYVVS